LAEKLSMASTAMASNQSIIIVEQLARYQHHKHRATHPESPANRSAGPDSQLLITQSPLDDATIACKTFAVEKPGILVLSQSGQYQIHT
jgi:hypothetical protein